MPLEDAAEHGRTWPFEEARKLLHRLERLNIPKDKIITFETGYGPSGLPHIGTFGEVARTTMVMTAFKLLSNRPTQLICFSDDLDGLRKVPDNIPNQDMVRQHLGKALTKVPDPFGTHESFGAHNNARLQSFLDGFGFEYTFKSATDCYQSGVFDGVLLRLLERYDAIMEIMLPSLRDERQKTYAPFLPICPETGQVFQVPVLERDVKRGTLLYVNPLTGLETETPVTGGHCKLQWKPDWAMRWTALGVDYEMAGKDLADSVKLSSKICKALDGLPPEGFVYELFLDAEGQKISKSKGNGLSIEEWLTYAPPESLALFMYKDPKRAKKLYFDVIPKHVDEYYSHLDSFHAQSLEDKINNPVLTLHRGSPPDVHLPVSFAMVLNLVSVTNAETEETLKGFIEAYTGQKVIAGQPLEKLLTYGMRYYHDFVKAAKVYRAPTDQERTAFLDLQKRLIALDPALLKAPEDIQSMVYSVGKDHGFEPLKNWFSALYQVLLGQEQGPRFGSFVAIYGRDETVALIETALKGAFLPVH